MTTRFLFKLLKAKVKVFLIKKRFIQSYKKKKAILLIFLVIVDIFILNDVIVKAQDLDLTKTITVYNRDYGVLVEAEASGDQPVDVSTEEEQSETLFDKSGIFYSYNAETGQTDSNPLITASGEQVDEGGVANNCLPFGTVIEVDGFGEFTVNDRMNSRYGCEVFDIFKWDKSESLKWGKKELNYYVK